MATQVVATMDLFAHAELDREALLLIDDAKMLFQRLAYFDEYSKLSVINEIKRALHEVSPMKAEPVDCVLWVPADEITANDYNPNAVAPPEMKLLEVSILEDGYTQPIVTFLESGTQREVVDGFHRNRVGRECPEVRNRVMGYLPVVTINESRTDRGDRIAATIRHTGRAGSIVSTRCLRLWSNSSVATGAMRRLGESWGWIQTRFYAYRKSADSLKCLQTANLARHGKPKREA